MRVKIGDTWYQAEPGQHLMLEFDDIDKLNIAALGPMAKRLAFFNDPDMTTEQKQDWMSVE
jgi:hypothetical protein